MSLTTLTAARILKGQLLNQSGEDYVTTMDTFPHVGLIKVYFRFSKREVCTLKMSFYLQLFIQGLTCKADTLFKCSLSTLL